MMYKFYVWEVEELYIVTLAKCRKKNSTHNLKIYIHHIPCKFQYHSHLNPTPTLIQLSSTFALNNWIKIYSNLYSDVKTVNIGL